MDVRYLKELANTYWVRPESALWLAKVMQELEQVQFEAPVLDLMCGHGIWSFIRAGGDFGPSFDCYQVTRNLGRYQEGIDIQDAFSEDYRPEIIRRPKYRIACGLDWKENNLKKCGTLDFYDSLVQADCNDPLPVADGEFRTIFCNTIYWVDNLEGILAELRRIVMPDGKIVLINYFPEINDYVDFYRGRVSERWLKLIDRGRSTENKHIHSKEGWFRVYEKAGLKVREYIPTVNRVYAHIWNIGLRPLAGMVLQMAQHVPRNEFIEIKRNWVETIETLMEPFLTDPEFSRTAPGQEVEAIFVLEKG